MMRSTTSQNNLNTLKKVARKTGIAIIWLAVWYLLYCLIQQEILVVSPAQMLSRLFEMSLESKFWIAVLSSLARILIGFLLAMFLGIIVAILTSISEFIRDLFYPIISIIRATPVASFIILALIWLNTTTVPIFTSFLMVFPLITENLFKGIQNTDHKLLEMADVFRFSKRQKATRIYIPSVMPYFIAACNNGVGLAWKAGIAAEVLGVPKHSIGTQLYSSKIYLETADVFAWTAVVILLSFLIEKVFNLLLRRAGKKYNV